MASKHETRAASERRRASKTVGLGKLDTFEDSISLLQINRISRRLAVTTAVAALVAELAGLGPREARR